MRPARRLGAVALALALLLALAAPLPQARAALPDAEARMLGHLNSAREGNGLSALAPHDGLTRVARDWAAQMARDYESGGERRSALRHNPSLTSQVPSGYRRVGENVGYSVLTGASQGALVDRLHSAYMDSSAHRANILGDFDRVGVGLTVTDDGTMWSAVVFMLEQSDSVEPDSGGTSHDGEGGQQESAPGPPPEPEPEPEPEPKPEPPTAGELFGPDWPEGYLVGDVDTALGLFANVGDVRRALVLLPGARRDHGPQLLSTTTPSVARERW